MRRYYESVTWPFIGGVAASLLPVSALLGEPLEELALTQLRGRLAARGVPGRDVPLPGAAVDLREEAGLLALIERHVRRSAAAHHGRGPLFVGGGQQVHRSARLVGPVILHGDAVVEERAVIMGPTVIGARRSRRARCDRGPVGRRRRLHGARRRPRPPQQRARRRVGRAARRPPPRSRRRRSSASRRKARWRSCRRRARATWRIKRVAETAFAGLLLLALLPLMALVAVFVALDSKGPILYGHEREGLHGRRFRCLKFRTMQVGAQALERELHAQSLVDGPQFKLAERPARHARRPACCGCSTSTSCRS